MVGTVVRVRTLKTRLHAQSCEDRPRKFLAETACMISEETERRIVCPARVPNVDAVAFGRGGDGERFGVLPPAPAGAVAPWCWEDGEGSSSRHP